MNGGTRESNMNELRANSVVLFVSLINFERLEEQEEVSWDSCTKAKATLASLTTSLMSQTNYQYIGSYFGHLFIGYTEGYMCLWTGVE